MCRNNFQNQNLGRVLDMDVIVTGCGGECFGEPIVPNMTLRQVLDIIVSNCENVQGGSKWYYGEDIPTFPANEDDYYLQSNGVVWVYDSVAGWEQTGINLKAISWGTITGNVSDQTDLVQFINTRITESINAAIAVLAGTGLSYDADGDKVQLGNEIVLAPTLIYRTIIYGETDAAAIYGFPSSTAGMPDETKTTVTHTAFSYSIKYDTKELTVSNTGLIFSENNQLLISATNTGTNINSIAGQTTIGGADGVFINGQGDVNIKAEYGLGARVILGLSQDPVLRNTAANILELGQLNNGKAGITLSGNGAPEFRVDGLIIPSADGKRWRIQVSNAGAVTVTQIV